MYRAFVENEKCEKITENKGKREFNSRLPLFEEPGEMNAGKTSRLSIKESSRR
ncbi:MAG: hypothetical protein ACRCYY_07355 [Trueperaceae bacterium]